MRVLLSIQCGLTLKRVTISLLLDSCASKLIFSLNLCLKYAILSSGEWIKASLGPDAGWRLSLWCTHRAVRPTVHLGLVNGSAVWWMKELPQVFVGQVRGDLFRGAAALKWILTRTLQQLTSHIKCNSLSHPPSLFVSSAADCVGVECKFALFHLVVFLGRAQQSRLFDLSSPSANSQCNQRFFQHGAISRA